MDEDTLDAASSNSSNANEIAKIEAESGSSMVTISPMEKARRRIARQQRQITRLRESVSYRLGRHVTIAIEKPWRIPFLPISFPIFLVLLGLERLGRRPQKVIEVDYTTASEINSQSTPVKQEAPAPENSVVFFPTNGVGFGHFTRLYSVARRLKKEDPNCEIIFFTTMPTLHIPYSEGYITYHLAGRKKDGNMEASKWNMMVEEMMTLVFETHRPKAFVFDGAFPYRGMLNAIRDSSIPNKVWVRRGMFKKGSKIPVDSIQHFDLVVHPGDAVENELAESEHDVETVHTPPMSLFDRNEIMSRDKARRRIGLPSDCVAVYVQLGAGRINDINSEVRIVVNAILANEQAHVILGESMLGERLDIDMDRVHIIRDYPNAIYLAAFDFSVQAGGYNSFHEMRQMRIPTLFLPNMNTGMDDQLARCNVAEAESWGIVNRDRSEEAINSDVESLLAMKVTESGNKIENGSDILSKRLAKN